MLEDYKNLIRSDNLPLVFFEQVKKFKQKPFMWSKKNNSWEGISWEETASQIRRFVNLLKSCGIRKGDKVLISSENRPEWVIADIAIMSIGAIVVPAYTTNTEDDHYYILKHSDAKMVIASRGDIVSRISLAANRINEIKHLILFDKTNDNIKVKGTKVLFWQDEIFNHQEVQDLDKTINKIKPNDISCFIYTSGTGGRPKGVMLTHKSINANVAAAHGVIFHANVNPYVFLSLLPLSHSYEHTAGLHFPIQLGAEIYFSESTEAVAQNLQEVKPTMMVAVPRLYEVLYGRIMNGVKAKGGISEILFMNAIKLGRKKLSGKFLLPHEWLYNKILDLLVRKKVKMRLGGNLRYFISGGAALNDEIGSFFLGLGVGILQGYGQTEASPLISVNLPEKIRIETVGPPVQGLEVKTDEFGELLVKGDCVMKGYWKDDKATSETIKNGWLHTGDLVEIDDDNYIRITGRKKEIIVNSGGDNIAPSKVEGILALENEIEQVMVYGDKQPWLSAVIVPSEDLKQKCKNVKNEIYNHLNIAINNANNSLSQIEKVRKFVVADEAFTVDNLQMTPTMKVRRHVVTEIYQNKILNLYSKNK